MPRVKLHRPTSPDDRPQAPQDEFEAGLFPEIAPEPAEPEKPKYEAWPDDGERRQVHHYREGKVHPQSNNPNLFEGLEREEEEKKDGLFHLPDIVLPETP